MHAESSEEIVIVAPSLGIFLIMAALVFSSCSPEAASSSYPALQTDRPSQRAVWVVDPVEPRADRPPVGRSLFDHLMTERDGNEAVYKIPFPFSDLVKKIEQQVTPDSQGLRLKRVLIPINRSLQRNSARSEFFAYPRAVVGADTGPRPQAGHSGMLLKDRLFLGYQENMGLIEVISYNEVAGRFEFQVVTDYRPGGSPRVSYANRALCTVCHQNQSPIFSKPLWEETNANRHISTSLTAQHKDFYGFPVRQGVDIPQAFDDATDRANLFSASQLLWRAGCGRSQAPSSIACRADLLTLTLQYLLNGKRRIESRSVNDTDRFTREFLARWQEQWPHGLLVPDPDIFNRNPVELFPQLFALRDFDRFAQLSAGYSRPVVRSSYEPSIPRRPKETWSASEGPSAVARLIAGLSEFLSDSDVKGLDRHLFRNASAAGDARRYVAQCRSNPRLDEWTVHLTLECRPQEPHDSGESFSMNGMIELNAGRVAGGMVEHLSFRNGDDLTGLTVSGGQISNMGTQQVARLTVVQSPSQLHARRADGNAIVDITIPVPSVRIRSTMPRPAEYSGTATIAVAADFSALRAAIAAMVGQTEKGLSDVFADKPFRRARVMQELHRHLQMPALEWCCLDDRGMPDLTVAMHAHEVESRTDDKGQGRDPAIKAFRRYCAACHHEEIPSPPNFMHGTAQQVKEQMDHCAERILMRLNMWQVPETDRPETPMPPVVALQRLKLSPEQWAGHADLALLKSYSAELLTVQDGKQVRWEDLAVKGYDNLRACMPPSKPTTISGLSNAVRQE
jgi:hypothetical protein